MQSIEDYEEALRREREGASYGFARSDEDVERLRAEEERARKRQKARATEGRYGGLDQVQLALIRRRLELATYEWETEDLNRRTIDLEQERFSAVRANVLADWDIHPKTIKFYRESDLGLIGLLEEMSLRGSLFEYEIPDGSNHPWIKVATQFLEIVHDDFKPETWDRFCRICPPDATPSEAKVCATRTLLDPKIWNLWVGFRAGFLGISRPKKLVKTTRGTFIPREIRPILSDLFSLGLRPATLVRLRWGMVMFPQRNGRILWDINRFAMSLDHVAGRGRPHLEQYGPHSDPDDYHSDPDDHREPDTEGEPEEDPHEEDLHERLDDERLDDDPLEPEEDPHERLGRALRHLCQTYRPKSFDDFLIPAFVGARVPPNRRVLDDYERRWSAQKGNGQERLKEQLGEENNG